MTERQTALLLLLSYHFHEIHKIINLIKTIMYMMVPAAKSNDRMVAINLKLSNMVTKHGSCAILQSLIRSY